MKLWLVSICTLASAFAATAAMAASNCTITATGVAFGTYSGVTSNPSAVPLKVTCPSGLAYTVGLNAGTASGATVTTRKMTGPSGQTVSYQLFSNAGRTANWGNTPGTDTVPATGTGASQTFQIYGSMAASQVVPAGTYTDTLTVTVIDGAYRTTATVTVTAIVQASCTVSTAPMAFGVYKGVQVQASTLVTVTCTCSTNFNIGLNAGLAPGATVTTRKMTGPTGNYLAYGLYRNASYTQNWGNTVGTDTLLTQASGYATGYGVNGRILAGQNLKPGSYSDTIIATVTY